MSNKDEGKYYYDIYIIELNEIRQPAAGPSLFILHTHTRNAHSTTHYLLPPSQIWALQLITLSVIFGERWEWGGAITRPNEI